MLKNYRKKLVNSYCDFMERYNKRPKYLLVSNELYQQMIQDCENSTTNILLEEPAHTIYQFEGHMIIPMTLGKDLFMWTLGEPKSIKEI